MMELLKGNVQQILREVNTKLKLSVVLNWRPGHFSFWIIKGHHHKRSIKPFSAAWRLIRWPCLVKVTLWLSFQQSTILYVTLTLTFRSLSIPGIDEIPLSHFTETEKFLKFTLIRQSHLTNLLAAENGFLILLWWYPFKIQKEKWAGLQFTSTDYLCSLLTPLRIRWTVPLSLF